jgi:hypothetical protein
MNLFGRPNHRLEHALVRIAASALGNLDDERCLRIDTTAKQTQNLFQIINVVGPYWRTGDMPVYIKRRLKLS